MKTYDVIVIGGGPAGLAAAVSADKKGASVFLIEREARLGGILKQCIHDGFGLIRFGEKLSGPEYVERFIKEFREREIDHSLLTFVTEMKRTDGGFVLKAVNRRGVQEYCAKALVLATGCRERTAKQVQIHGTRPAGIMTAGTAQHFVNLQGKMPAGKCVILGSGDIGLIMARRLTLEGAEVLGVYEVKPTPSGLTRNIVQCLDDYGIPLHLSHTVTRVFGEQRLTAVEVAEVDSNMKPVEATKKRVACDSLILSVGLIPENEMAEKLGVRLDARTKGPVCDNRFMTETEGVFSCGNALHVNDLVDYVSESGELAGAAAAEFTRRGADTVTKQGKNSRAVSVELKPDTSLQYLVPQKLTLSDELKQVVFYFRSREVLSAGTLVFLLNGKEIFHKKYRNLKPPEMERLELDLSTFKIEKDSRIEIAIRKEGDI
ncbi:FAD-dependent oxidoreductase [Faecalicatena orotica]|uniref:Thioredoxin reductase n=1 Tax=Faecalicatena orotica TaxID=1544 RepID=A0A2Y9BFI8_9FIRM|nr:FAD-dependent oxidoreductase [Faecalicatena orotica]PWJ28269.1 thioredoxin reductase [Faecalicatena orotica]SSA56724.1 Thioredoxin reductase [Faecalicatena orotica]